MTIREHKRRRLRSVCERIQKEGWKVVLLSELKADESGMGEDEGECVVIRAKKAGIVLRGKALQKWRKDQRRWFGERLEAVEVGEMHLVAAYQPMWGIDEAGMERYRRDLESQVAIGRNARLVIGGDFNASVGMNAGRPGVCI